MSRSDRFSLTRLSTESLLLDLKTGNLFQLNESASAIWSDWLAGQSEEVIASGLRRAYQLDSEEALQHVSGTLKLAARDSGSSAHFEYVYERSSSAYTFSKDGIPLLSIDLNGDWMTANSAALKSRADLFSVLLSVSPKVAALRGHFVLHASAALLGSTAVAFCGLSGAGKTTTVRALVEAGAEPICEDKLVIRRRAEAPGFEAVRGAEEIIKHWAEEALDDLWSGRPASCGALSEIARGPAVRLTEIGFIAADQRTGTRMTGAALSPAEAAGRVFSNLFYGSDTPDSWRSQLRNAVDLADTTISWAIKMPDGLAALRQAAFEIVRSGSLRL
ncbi:MAG TPA: PqqD family peptide modification chaperone [Polyangia bacterium]|nr:PqqD family peptide modification chaperone [Polyangia bacterium]